MTEANLVPELNLPLRKALTVGDGADARSLSELQLREPLLGEMVDAEVLGESVAITIRVLSLMTKVPEGDIKALAARDLRKAGDYVSGFLATPIEDVDSANLPDQRDFPLSPPIAAPTGEMSAITLGEPTAGQLEQYDSRTGWARTLKAIVTVAAIPEVAARRIPIRTAWRMEAYLDAFFHGAPTTGAAS